MTIGEGDILQSHVVIEGRSRSAAEISSATAPIIGAPPQDLSFSPERKTKVEIGDDNVIREYCTIHRGSPDGQRHEQWATTIS